MGFAVSIVLVAIGMTLAAPGAVARCDDAAAADVTACAPAQSMTPVVAGYQAAPTTADRGLPAQASAQSDQATYLVALASALVFVSVFAILFSYRQRPGGVRAQER